MNNRYIYSYYNALVSKPYLKYDVDYYATACTRGYDWLRENIFSQSDKKYLVVSRIFTPKQYGESLGDTNVTVVAQQFMTFAETDCDYFILSPQIIHPKVLKKFYPPKGTVYVEYMGDIPLCAVVEKKNKYDCHGIAAVRQGKMDEGIDLLEKAYQFDPNNFGIWFWMGYGYFYQQKYEKSIEFFAKYVNFWPNGEMLTLSYLLCGESFIQLKKYDQAIQVLNNVLALNNGGKDYQDAAYLNLGICFYNKKDFRKAIACFEGRYNKRPDIANILYNCYMQVGDKQKAQMLLAGDK